MSFYMKLVPTGDEIVLFEGKANDGIEGMQQRLAARVWKGTTQSGHEIEVAVVKILKIEDVDSAVLRHRLQEIADTVH